jgi:menaquinone reductase, multiheme cytochrome c subunit
MSTSDDHATKMMKNAGHETAIQPSTKGTAEKQDKGSGGTVILFFVFGVFVSLILGWIIFPKLLYSKKKQPIDFNHAFHVTQVDNGCDSCHFFREDGTFSGVPKLEQCIDCHEEIQGTDPDEIKFVEDYVSKGRQVPWLIYAKQPNCVFFSHAAHIRGAGMDCVTCHGHIGESESLKVYQQNRITGYSRDIWGENIAGLKKNPWDRMKMDDCAECHQRTAATIEKTGVKSPTHRYIDNIINVFSPSSLSIEKGDSVQTQRDACFVCHK